MALKHVAKILEMDVSDYPNIPAKVGIPGFPNDEAVDPATFRLIILTAAFLADDDGTFSTKDLFEYISGTTEGVPKAELKELQLNL